MDCVPSAGPRAKALGSGPGCIHYSCLTRASRSRTQGGEARGGRSLAHPVRGMGDSENSSLPAGPPTAHPPAGIWLHPKGSGPELQREVGKLRAGRGASLAPRMAVGTVSFFSLAQIIQPPKSGGLPRGQAGSDKLLPALHPGREAAPGGRADRKK